MENTANIAKALGQQQMADALGVGLTAVNNAVARGRFPSSWYFVVMKLAEDAGTACPPCVFRMKVMNDTHKTKSDAGSPESEVLHVR